MQLKSRTRANCSIRCLSGLDESATPKDPTEDSARYDCAAHFRRRMFLVLGFMP